MTHEDSDSPQARTAGDERSRRAHEIIADLKGLEDPRCGGCGGALCGHEAVLGWAMGFAGSTHCATCLAQGLGQSREQLLGSALSFVDSLECWRAGWLWASEDEGFGDALQPGCLWPAGASAAAAAVAPVAAVTSHESTQTVDATWDAGEMACGELLLQLRLRLKEMPAGATLHLRALDPASPEDLPAWCSLTGHTMLESDHPDYWIRRRED